VFDICTLTHKLCSGSEARNQTVTGPPGKCELNAPTSIMVTRDRQIYIAGLTNMNYRDYKSNTSVSIFHMDTYGN